MVGNKVIGTTGLQAGPDRLICKDKYYEMIDQIVVLQNK